MQEKSNQSMIPQQQFIGFYINCPHNKYSFAPNMLYNASSSHFTLPIIKMSESTMDAHYSDIGERSGSDYLK
jgi:hypothetical protein